MVTVAQSGLERSPEATGQRFKPARSPMEQEKIIEKPNNKESLPGRLLDRPTFSWPGERQMNFRQKLFTSCAREAEEKLRVLSEDSALSPIFVLERIRSKVTSWQAEELLDHSLLKRA